MWKTNSRGAMYYDRACKNCETLCQVVLKLEKEIEVLKRENDLLDDKIARMNGKRNGEIG